jgi:hypothetical protein
LSLSSEKPVSSRLLSNGNLYRYAKEASAAKDAANEEWSQAKVGGVHPTAAESS